MGRQEEIEKISDWIAIWQYRIDKRKALHFYDINHVAENIARQLLNEIYNYDLVNLNYEKGNYPGIDLGDKKKKIGFQITSEQHFSKKIKESLETFVNGPNKTFSRGIRFLFLNGRTPNLKTGQKESFAKLCPGFDSDRDVLTDKDLIREIAKTYDDDRKRFQRIKNLLQEEFGGEVKEEDGMSLLERLYKGSRRYYESLTGVNGRFKHLNIADIILPHPALESKQKWIDTRVSVDQEDQRQKDEVSMNMFDTLPQLWEQECKHTVLVGEGGMSKTVSLIRLWEEYTRAESYAPGSLVPVFIQMNEWNRFAETNQENFITWMINRYYLEDAVEEKKIREMMKQPIKEGDSFVPSVILLLDGFNEITADDRTPLLLELRDLIEGFPGVQMLVTSRYDMRGNLNWGQFHLLHLLELSNKQVNGYLNKFGIPVSVLIDDGHQDDKGDRLLELIRNPMMLAIYASTCEVEREHSKSSNFDFKDRVETPGELLWNFIESQVARMFDRKDKPEGEPWFYRFLLKCMLPALGFEMEKMGRFDLTPSELDEMFFKYFRRFCQRDFLSFFREYRNCVKHLNVKECDDLEMMERIEGIFKILVNELCMLVKEGDSFRFLHQNFRDYFAAVHILNEAAIGLEKKEIPDVLKERTLPVYLLRFMGEIEGEHYCKPVLVPGEGWKVRCNKQSLLVRILEICRGCFDGSLGYGVWNAVETLKVMRGELSGFDLSRLDLSGVGFNGVRCSRFYGDEYLFAVFDESLVHESNIFPHGHFSIVKSAVYSLDGKKILSTSGDGTIKEWDVATGECLKSFEGHAGQVTSAVYSADDKKILSACLDQTIKEWDVATGQCLKTFGGHKFGIESAIYSADGKKILSSSRDQTIKEWSVDTGKLIRTFLNIPGLLVHECTFKNLHPRSKMSEKSKQLLKMYGAVVE